MELEPFTVHFTGYVKGQAVKAAYALEARDRFHALRLAEEQYIEPRKKGERTKFYLTWLTGFDYQRFEESEVQAIQIEDVADGYDQYFRGHELLWMAHFRKTPDSGDMDGGAMKYSGKLEDVAKEVAKHAEENNVILQCLRRRY